MRKKFTLPGVKEGAIIDYEYTVTSDFLFNLQPWYFQGDIPCLWSEYRAALPQFLKYIMLQQGIYKDLAVANADAIKKMKPEMTIWTSGNDTSDAVKPIRELFQSLPPLLSNIHAQTGVASSK